MGCEIDTGCPTEGTRCSNSLAGFLSLKELEKYEAGYIVGQRTPLFLNASHRKSINNY